MAVFEMNGNGGGGGNPPIGQTFNTHVDDQGRIAVFVYDVNSITIKGYSSGGYTAAFVYDDFTGGNTLASVASLATVTVDVSSYDVVYFGTGATGGGTVQVTFDS